MRPSSYAVFMVAAAACATPRPATAPIASAPSPTAAPSPVASAVAPVAPALPAASDSRAVFEQTVEPILVSSCMPCHFPGGKMYATMPFDDPDVVSSHSEGVLRRIKAPEKRGPLESWLGSVPAVPR